MTVQRQRLRLTTHGEGGPVTILCNQVQIPGRRFDMLAQDLLLPLNLSQDGMEYGSLRNLILQLKSPQNTASNLSLFRQCRSAAFRSLGNVRNILLALKYTARSLDLINDNLNRTPNDHNYR